MASFSLHDLCTGASGVFIRAAIPSEWRLTPLVTLTALLLPLRVFLIQRIRMQQKGTMPFRFLDLPPELRDMVYEHLLEDPYYPPLPSTAKTGFSNPLDWILSIRKASTSSSSLKYPIERKSNWIFLANKQIYAEYLDVLCKKSTFKLTVSPSNYSQLDSLSTSTTSSPSPSNQKIWTIAPETLQQLRKCDIKLITTSSMLGVPDPRNMAPASWPLTQQVKSELREVKNVSELNLHVRAIGDPLWNPLWVWYHASQSFKCMGAEPSPSSDSEINASSPSGPKLNRITFSLDTWSPGENYLERDSEGKWAWWCMEGHCVGGDGEAGMTVREFCARLYADCHVCSPESRTEEI